MVDPVVTCLSLCSGVGGLELGIRIAVPGLRLLGCVERDAYAASVLLARMEDEALEPAPIFCGDMADFDAREFAGVDILCAGLPCQPYSVAGKREGHDDERAIWPEFLRIVSESRPAVVFLENVPAFLQFFRPVGDELCRLGYEIEDALLLAASDVGASHKRERVFLLAHAARVPGGERPGRERVLDVRSEGVADADEHGQRREGLHLPERGSHQAVRHADGTGEEMADAAQQPEREPHDEERAEPRGDAWEDVGGRGLRIPPAPPGPDDAEGWRHVPAWLHPAIPHAYRGGRVGLRGGEGPTGRSDGSEAQIEPGVRLLPDATSPALDASRADQLRCSGNGVVPDCAAFAFAVLARRAGVLLK